MKQTFSAGTFAAKTFASGTWRGIGSGPAPPGGKKRTFAAKTFAANTFKSLTWTGGGAAPPGPEPPEPIINRGRGTYRIGGREDVAKRWRRW